MSIENQHQLLDDIDARQDDILQQLDQLNRDIEQTIRAIVGDRDEAGAGEAVAEQDGQDRQLGADMSTERPVSEKTPTSAAAAIAALHASTGASGNSINAS